MLTERIRLNGNDIDAYEDRYWLYAKYGKYAQAIADLSAVLKLLPNVPEKKDDFSNNSTAVPSTTREKALFHRYSIYFETQKYPLVVQDTTLYIALIEARKADIVVNASFLALHEIPHRGVVLRHINGILSRAYEYRGMANAEQGKYDLAIDDMRQAGALDSDAKTRIEERVSRVIADKNRSNGSSAKP